MDASNQPAPQISSGLSEMLQDFIDAEHMAIGHFKTMREFLPEGERATPEYNLGFDPYGICDDPKWVPATTVYTVDWDNETLEPMPAQDLWEFLKKHKDALHSSRADGRVMCRWSGCTKGLVKKLELRRHVRVEHQLIAKWCTNKGCTFWDWDDAFHHKHRTCPCGPSGRFELKLVDPLFVARFSWL